MASVSSGNMKAIRNWKSLDWCTGEVFTYTQVIKATDEKDRASMSRMPRSV
ncbi:MAG: hypothetical protein U0T36_04165 [Saprospiraceae bacterium]